MITILLQYMSKDNSESVNNTYKENKIYGTL